jgi:hypothetical protein
MDKPSMPPWGRLNGKSGYKVVQGGATFVNNPGSTSLSVSLNSQWTAKPVKWLVRMGRHRQDASGTSIVRQSYFRTRSEKTELAA